MSCLEVLRDLQLYVDGETDDATRRRIEAHLADCRHCGLEAEVYRRIRWALTDRRPLDPAMVGRLRAFGEALLKSPEVPSGEAPSAETETSETPETSSDEG